MILNGVTVMKQETTRIQSPTKQIAPRLQRALTRRYCVALGLVFCILIATLCVFTRQSAIAQNDAYLINTSGMQRMLSQRVALLASDLRKANNEQDAQQHAIDLGAAIDRMYANHVALSTGKLGGGRTYSLSSAIEQRYFGELALDERVRDYCMAARTYLDMYTERGLFVLKAAVRAEGNLAFKRRDLLKDLNGTVALYEAEAKARIKGFQTMEFAFFGIGVLILIGEILFIFRPMVRMIVERAGELEAAHASLLDVSKQLIEKHEKAKQR